jgi:hypothetical protein
MNRENPTKKAKIEMENDDDYEETMSNEDMGNNGDPIESSTMEDASQIVTATGESSSSSSSTVMDIESLPLAPSIEVFFQEPENYAPRREFLQEFVDVSFGHMNLGFGREFLNNGTVDVVG